MTMARIHSIADGDWSSIYNSWIASQGFGDLTMEHSGVATGVPQALPLKCLLKYLSGCAILATERGQAWTQVRGWQSHRHARH